MLLTVKDRNGTVTHYNTDGGDAIVIGAHIVEDLHSHANNILSMQPDASKSVRMYAVASTDEAAQYALEEALKHFEPLAHSSQTMPQENTFGFERALEILLEERCVARKHWAEAGIYLWLKDSVREDYLDGAVKRSELLNNITLLTSDRQTRTGWRALRTDLQAEDWVEVPLPHLK